MTEPSEHPVAQIPGKTALYRPADAPNEFVWGLKVEMIEVPDDEVDDYLIDGWFAHPLDIDKPPPGPLERPVTEIVADLELMTLAELEDLHKAETEGKARKGLLGKIAAAIAAKKA